MGAMRFSFRFNSNLALIYIIFNAIILAHEDDVNSVAFFPDEFDGKVFIASASKDSTIRIWSFDGKRLESLGEEFAEGKF
jgi:WD40 repeat protein